MLSKTHTKYIQSLLHKKFRDQSGLFIAEGPKVVEDLLNCGEFKARELFAVDKWLSAHVALQQAYPAVTFNEVEDFELEKISALSTPHLVLAVFEKRTQPLSLNLEGKITLILDTIQDPGNLGTIIRTADWFGIESIICSEGCADMYNPKVVQGTMGSLGRVNIIYTGLGSWLQKHRGIRTYAATLAGRPIQEVNGIREGFLIIGNEARGIGEELLDLVDEKITIPRSGEAESLNAAVATGILLSRFLQS